MVKPFFRSFLYAFQGFITALRTEANLRLHFIAAVITVTIGIWLKLNTTEWAIIVICIVSVFGFEILNTAIEELCNYVSIEKHPVIKKIKDIAAASVLLISIGAAISGLLIFLPKLIDKF